MSVSITLPQDLEQSLQSHAKRIGVPFETLLERTIVEQWGSILRGSGLSTRETDLRLRLQTLFPAEQTQEYQNLCAKSDVGTITETERERLLSLIEQRDHQNAERLTIAAELAKLHSVSLRDMMTQLGIRPE
jgi:hypothetical protein